MLIRGEDSARNLSSTLTEEEKWYFDLHGYLILRQVIRPDEVLQILVYQILQGFRVEFVSPSLVRVARAPRQRAADEEEC